MESAGDAGVTISVGIGWLRAIEVECVYARLMPVVISRSKFLFLRTWFHRTVGAAVVKQFLQLCSAMAERRGLVELAEDAVLVKVNM
jgi:hypothetical protein